MGIIIVDKDDCISCGLCIENLPDVFRFDENGKAEAFEPTGASVETIEQMAIDICPVFCIHWQE